MGRLIIAILLVFVSISAKSQQFEQLDLLVKAERTLAEGDTSRALLQFQNVLKKYPQSYAAITRLAEINFDKKAYRESTQYIYLAMDIVEQALDEHMVSMEKEKPHASAREKQEAEDLKQRYQRDLASLYHLLGLNRNREEKYTEAISAYKDAITTWPKASYYVDLALTQLRIESFNDVITTLHKAIDADSTFYKSYYNLANIYNQTNQYDSAAYYYNKTLSLNDSLTWPYLYLGKIYTEQAHYEKAIKSLNKFITLDSTKIEPYFRRALLYTNKGAFAQAIRDWSAVIDRTQEDPEAYRNRGLTYFYMDNYEMAIKDFDTSLTLKPGEPYTLINRGYCYYLADEPNHALQDLNQGLMGLPKYNLGYYFRALTYLKLKKKSKACADLKKALELGLDEKDVDKKLIRKCL